jgi:hypothetical protein
MMACNVISPQVFWWRRFVAVFGGPFLMSIFVNIGMWFERFVIIASTLARDYLPSSWSYYTTYMGRDRIVRRNAGIVLYPLPDLSPGLHR